MRTAAKSGDSSTMHSLPALPAPSGPRLDAVVSHPAPAPVSQGPTASISPSPRIGTTPAASATAPQENRRRSTAGTHASRNPRPGYILHPTFTPSEADLWRARDPWTVRSVPDLLRVYLPETSLILASGIASGIMAGRIYKRMLGDPGPFVFPAVYSGVLLLFLLSICIQGNRCSSARTRVRIRTGLVVCLVISGLHLAPHLLLKVAAR